MNIRYWNLYFIRLYFARKKCCCEEIVGLGDKEEVIEMWGATSLFWRKRLGWFWLIYTGSAAAIFFGYRGNRILFYGGASNHRSFEFEQGLSNPAWPPASFPWVLYGVSQSGGVRAWVRLNSSGRVSRWEVAAVRLNGFSEGTGRIL